MTASQTIFPGNGDLASRLRPVSRVFGLDRGKPIDRYYIERFLSVHAGSIRGRVLEVADDTYTRQFGGAEVEKADILHSPPGTRRSTIVADLTHRDGLSPETFDCIILTQTLHCLVEIQNAVANVHRALKAGGTVLATMPGISQISRYDMDRWGDYWRFTTRSARAMFAQCFRPGDVKVEAYGNVLAATAFLQGYCTEELSRAELDHIDPDYELLIAVAACKNG